MLIGWGSVKNLRHVFSCIKKNDSSYVFIQVWKYTNWYQSVSKTILKQWRLLEEVYASPHISLVNIILLNIFTDVMIINTRLVNNACAKNIFYQETCRQHRMHLDRIHAWLCVLQRPWLNFHIVITL